MYRFSLRAGLRPLAAIIGLVASATLAACADATTSPAISTPSRASAAAAPGAELVNTTVTLFTASRGSFYAAGSASIDVAVSCSANEMFDVVVEIEQEQKAGGTRIIVAGADTVPEVDCGPGSSGWKSVVVPTTGAFKRGSATVRMHMFNYQPWVTPAQIEKRVRLIEGVA